MQFFIGFFINLICSMKKRIIGAMVLSFLFLVLGVNSAMAGVLSQIVILEPVDPVVAGATSSLIHVQLQDQFGIVASSTDGADLTLSADPSSGTFIAATTNGCKSNISSLISVDRGDMNKYFCYKNVTPGTYTLTVSAPELISGSHTITVLDSAPTADFEFSSLDNFNPGLEGQFTVKVANVANIADDTMIRYKAVATIDGAPLSGQIIYYPEPGDDINDPARRHSFVTGADGVAFFGPASGFPLMGPMAALKTADGLTTPFATTLGVGSYTLRVSIVNAADESELVTSDVQEFSVLNPLPADTTGPTITILGDNPATIRLGDTYTDAGASSTDDVDGDIVVTASSTVDTSVAGTYSVIYSAIDNSNNTATATRTVMVLDEVVSPTPTPEPTPEPTPTPTTTPVGTRSGSRVSGSYLANRSGSGSSTPVILLTSTPGIVLGTSTVSSTTCDLFIGSYMGWGGKNDKEDVKKLQRFLNKYLVKNIPVTGVFGPLTDKAVKEFQLRHSEEVLMPWVKIGKLPNDKTATGYVYKTTLNLINRLNCPNLNISAPVI